MKAMAIPDPAVEPPAGPRRACPSRLGSVVAAEPQTADAAQGCYCIVRSAAPCVTCGVAVSCSRWATCVPGPLPPPQCVATACPVAAAHDHLISELRAEGALQGRPSDPLVPPAHLPDLPASAPSRSIRMHALFMHADFVFVRRCDGAAASLAISTKAHCCLCSTPQFDRGL